MAGRAYIDKLPETERSRVIKALTEAGDSPDYRGLIRALKLKCSYTALWRYHLDKVKPAMARNAAAIIAASNRSGNANVHMDKGDSINEQVALRREAESLTQQALRDDPIVQAVIAKRQRLNQAIEETHSNKQFDAYAKLESVDLKALEMHAKAIQHPGFVASAPAQSAGATVVVVMPTAGDQRMAAWQARQGAIDVTPEED